jgi:iron(III) transport system substrate-binding protein
MNAQTTAAWTRLVLGGSMRIRKKHSLMLVGSLALFGAAACGGPTQASTTALATSVSRACQLGAQEGALNFWNADDQASLQKEIAPFEAAHPKIKITLGLYEPDVIVQKLATEAQAHHALTADLVEGDLPTFSTLFKDNLVTDYDWTQLGVPSDLIVKNTNNIRTVRVSRKPDGLVYNTNLVKAADIPNTWEGLINSKWASKVVYDPRGSYLQGLAVAWGDNKASTWFTNFLKTDKPVPITGGTAGEQAVASGQYPLSTSGAYDQYLNEKQKGAPVGIKFLDVVPVNDYNTALVKDAAHPNAALCFMSYWYGSQATALRVKYGNKGNDNVPTGTPPGGVVAAINTPAEAAVAAKFSALIAAASK